MTKYEVLTKKIEALYGAAVRCEKRGKLDMVAVWLHHHNVLIVRRNALTIQEAEA